MICVNCLEVTLPRGFDGSWIILYCIIVIPFAFQYSYFPLIKIDDLAENFCLLDYAHQMVFHKSSYLTFDFKNSRTYLPMAITGTGTAAMTENRRVFGLFINEFPCIIKALNS